MPLLLAIIIVIVIIIFFLSNCLAKSAMSWGMA